ncbi:hypothetical protein GCM10007424_17240 [Flavobacterium suaedae]|uniref:Transcriptional regulator n=1 Tax=Flavobacterium suaedae TaxID=1767027 RepID=A0ABQ1JWY4_9FLAO|nr:transcriptional regulator [Flavobacterium suaedae]GGB77721.1 hypothetical protein GCM10007424_17240 [Flavobacterium suaedae]
MSDSKNDIAWQKIFDKYNIVENVENEGHINISAKEINEFREARLMTKFDHKSQLPQLFKNNNLSILPDSRGSYIIGNFETFADFNKEQTGISEIEFPNFLESIDYKNITSESTAINCAYVSNIFKDFTGEENLLPTVSGRMSSSIFEFQIKSKKGDFQVNVNNSQIEIDGGYEGDNSLSLIEAKNYISDDFLIRQLYYPYKLWEDKIYKRVRPIFLTYSNGIFDLREYEFKDINHYNSLVLVQHKKYTIREGTFNLETVEEIIQNTPLVKEPEVPFPQADSFERVINLCELLKQRNFMTKEEITQEYDFDKRQTDYYSNAGRYLGIIKIKKDTETGKIGCFLTNKGYQLFEISLGDRQKEFLRLIVSHEPFKKTLITFLKEGELPIKDKIVEIMKGSKLYNIDRESTYYRRASTIVGWINWIMNQVEE